LGVPTTMTAVAPIHWFLALNQAHIAHDGHRYESLAKVAVYSALVNTSLIPHFIYDGKPNDFTSWLESHCVTVHYRRTFLYEDLERQARQQHSPLILDIGSGTFLRLEVPEMAAELGITDRLVLYTDLDVMFMGEVCDYLSDLRPRYFAVAPEFDQADYINMNAGVMLLNAEGLRESDAGFRAYTRDHLPELASAGRDQDAYRNYFEGQWDRLPVQYNWKPYWGYDASARIVHFHGPKPTQRDRIKSGVAAPIIISLATEAYYDYCQIWDRMLADVE
jgi:lipopolysaccharide biosynthesis glycosyltransferase